MLLSWSISTYRFQYRTPLHQETCRNHLLGSIRFTSEEFRKIGKFRLHYTSVTRKQVRPYYDISMSLRTRDQVSVCFPLECCRFKLNPAVLLKLKYQLALYAYYEKIFNRRLDKVVCFVWIFLSNVNNLRALTLPKAVCHKALQKGVCFKGNSLLAVNFAARLILRCGIKKIVENRFWRED